MTGTAELFQFGGILPSKPGKDSPRSRGIKQGVFIFLFGVLLFPILGMLSVFLFRFSPWPAGLVFFLTVAAGLLRMAYALMFEQRFPIALPSATDIQSAKLKISSQPSALPPQQIFPAQQYAGPGVGKWRDTNDLEPTSVTENTTRLLENESDLPK